MDPIVILPIALAVAWAASRKKKTTNKKTTTEEQPPPVHDDPFGPFDGPGGEEPWRPGGPEVDGPKGPKPFPGPSGGVKDPDLGDPSPTEIYPGTTIEDIEEHENAAFGLFVASDCESVFIGDRWLTDVFMPQARGLVIGNPEAFHHPVGVMWELLVVPQISEDDGAPTPAAACIAAWGEFTYGAFTPLGTFSGWIDDPDDTYWDYVDWFNEEYPDLSDALWDIYIALWDQADLAEVFDRDWPADAPSDEDDIEFEPTGT